jgi:hypothetical protein
MLLHIYLAIFRHDKIILMYDRGDKTKRLDELRSQGILF